MGAACLEITYPFPIGILVGLVLCKLRSGENSCCGCLNSPVLFRRQLYITPTIQFFRSFMSSSAVFPEPWQELADTDTDLLTLQLGLNTQL